MSVYSRMIYWWGCVAHCRHCIAVDSITVEGSGINHRHFRQHSRRRVGALPAPVCAQTTDGYRSVMPHSICQIISLQPNSPLAQLCLSPSFLGPSFRGAAHDRKRHCQPHGSQPYMTTTYCSHDLFEYPYCNTSYLVTFKLTMPSKFQSRSESRFSASYALSGAGRAPDTVD